MRSAARALADLFPTGVAFELAEPAQRRDFLAGRACARRALVRLGGPDGPVAIGPDREPAWPEGFVGSIAHAEGLACAAAARAGEIIGLGLDVERLAPLDGETARLVCSEDERSAFDDPLIVFCAKEAFYKAQFPLTRKFLDFADVAVRPGDDPGGFVTEAADAPFRMEGRWSIEAGFLFAGVVLRR